MAEERKLATVLFADLVGSTALAADQDPERTRARLERFYDAMASEIEASGGTVEKFAGDAVMAVFGAPAAHEDHAERALHTALAMQRRLGTLFDGELALRIGVNTGDVVVGTPRERSSFVSGDAVNVAARLEQGASPGDILVGERTVAAVRGAFEFDAPMSVEAKGKPAGVPARRLVRALSLMRPRGGVPGMRSAFVGREDELHRLRAAYTQMCEQGRPKLVTVIGDAGVGKTRLLRELWQSLDDAEPRPLRRTGRCLAYGRGTTYWPLGEILKEHFGILDADPPDEIRRTLEPREILGLTLGLDVAGDLHPLAARDRMHTAWIEFIETLTAEQPVVMLVEDLHWAEAELLNLLELLARDVRGALLVIATARPDFVDLHPGWAVGRIDAETLWLDPLNEEDARRLVEELLAYDLPDDIHERVTAKAEGNPFFVEEVLATLIDRGILSHSNGGWSVFSDLADEAVPDSVQAVVAARIDLLPKSEKDAIQAAAVIGRAFWTGPVYALLDDGADLRVLEDRDFIRRRSGSTLAGEVEYAFKHALTREVAYDSLTRARRAQLHARFGEWLETAIGDEAAALLAHHYAEAVRPEDADIAWAAEEERFHALVRRAVQWLRRAGELAFSRYELDDAIALFSRALELGPTTEEEIDLYELLGRAHAFRFDGEAFWDATRRALDRTEDPTRQAELYTLLTLETAGRAGMWRTVPDRELIAGWVHSAIELSEPNSTTHLRALVGGFWYDVVDAETAARAAAELEGRGGRDRIDALETQKVLAFRRADYAETLHLAEEQVRAADELGDPEMQSAARESTVGVFTLCGRITDAERIAHEYGVIVERFSPHHRLHAVAIQLEVDEVRGDWHRVVELVPTTQAVVAENADTPCIRNARSLLVSAAAAQLLGDEDLARELEAQTETRAVEMRGYEDILLGPRLRLALARNDLETVARLAHSPDARHRQVWSFPGAAASYLDALAALRDGERLEREALAIGKEGTVLRPFALRALGLARGDESLITQAADDFDRLGLPLRAAETRTLLG